MPGSSARALRKLDWLVVKDNWITETATFWKNSPEVKNGEVKTADIKTEVFYLPATQVAEIEGTFTNTQRLLQFHHKAAEAPGDCRSDTWFSYELGKRLKKLYAGSPPRHGTRAGKNLVWDFEHEDAQRAQEGRAVGAEDFERVQRLFHRRSATPLSSASPSSKTTARRPARRGFIPAFIPAPGKLLADRRTPDPPGKPGSQLEWGWAWPANRRVMYNRASADPEGKPWSEKKKWVWWDAAAKKWVGYDVPDFIAVKPPDDKAKPGTPGMDALPGTAPFIMRPDGLGWLFVPAGLVDGPLPTHYEPVESPVANTLYKQQTAGLQALEGTPGNELAKLGDPQVPLRPDHLPAHRALSVRRHEPLAAVVERASARAFRRDQPGVGQ